MIDNMQESGYGTLSVLGDTVTSLGKIGIGRNGCCRSVMM